MQAQVGRRLWRRPAADALSVGGAAQRAARAEVRGGGAAEGARNQDD